ncbi:MAG: hypothetical protein ABR569_07235 [Gaiellaceae bacterium]
MTTQLPGGALRSVETQAFTFGHLHRSTATFVGQIVGGTGRFIGAAGTVSGGGTGHNAVGLWHETFHLD